MSSSLSLLAQIFHHISKKRKSQLAILSFVSILSGFSELLSLGAVFPFLAILSEPASVWNLPFVSYLAAIFRWSSPGDLLVPAALLFGVAALLASSIRLLNLWLTFRVSAAIGADLTGQAYRNVLYWPYKKHVETNSSVVINSVISQVSSAAHAITLICQTFTSLIVSASLLSGLFYVNARISSIAILVIASSYLVVGSLSGRVLVANSLYMDLKRTRVYKVLQEGLGAIRDVLLDGTQGFYLSIYQGSDRLLRRAAADNSFLMIFPRYALEAVGLCLIAIVALLASNGQSSSSAIPVLGVFALGAQRLLPALQQAYAGWSSLKASDAELHGALEILSQSPSASIESGSRLEFNHKISFRNVCFRYSDSGPLVLNHVSFDIFKGQTVGFVGQTGSGKSTGIDLLMGLLEPSEGAISVDGFDLLHNPDDSALTGWRRLIAHVPQSIFLIDATIAENIAFGVAPEMIDYSRVVECAQKAQISKFIESSPEGYSAVVGERGIRLSGGQRQRIGIARALYKKAEVLILDEATSALDNDTEQAVIDAINKLDRNLTVVMIAHRLSTVANCDRVIRLEHGRLVADGPPSEVLAQT